MEHVRAKGLVRDASDACFLPRLAEHAPEEIIRIDRCPLSRRKNEGLRPRILTRRTPPFQFRVNRSREPNRGVLPSVLVSTSDAVSNAGVNPKAVLPFVIPAEREHLAGAKPKDKEHPDDEPVAIV